MASSGGNYARSNPPAASLYGFARSEAERHKWIESQKRGRDLGDEAIRDWGRRYWRQCLRARWIEPLNGERRWAELPEADFGLLQRDFHPNRTLTAGIVDRIKQGGENLDILVWVLTSGASVEDAVAILERLDINSARLRF